MSGKIFQRFAAILFATVLLICALLTARALESQRYGYRQLENDAQRTAYNAIAQGVGNVEAVICFSSPGITLDDIDKAVHVVFSDYPEYFWFGCNGNYSLDSNGNVEFTASGYIVDGKTVTADNISSYQAQLESAATAALAGMPSGSDYDKALYLHDYIASTVEYVSDGGKDDQTAYGALVEGKAVCAGYARAYQYLLRKAGIESWYVTGSSEGQAHGWNLVFLGGKCYYTDVTWDDQKSEIIHTYFMLSLEQMNPTHTVSVEDAAMLSKSCGHDDMGYFAVKGGAGTGIGVYTKNVSAKDIAGWCKLKSEGTYTCLIQDNTGLLSNWLNTNWKQVCDELGLSGSISYSCSSLDNEYRVTFSGTPAQQHTHDAILTKVPAKSPSCTAGGNIEYYTCSGCQTLFKDKAGTVEITDPSSVKLAPTEHNYTNIKSNDTAHWVACSCGAEQSGSRTAHTDSNKDNKCDTCSFKMQSSSQEQQESQPSTEASIAPTEEPVTTPAADPTENTTQTPTQSPTDAPTEEATIESTTETTESASAGTIESDGYPSDNTDSTQMPVDTNGETQTSAAINSPGADDELNKDDSVAPVVVVIGITLAIGGAVTTVIIGIRRKKR